MSGSHDPEAAQFLGSVVADEQQVASYRLERFLGGGGMALTFLATRRAPDGESIVVLKLMRPTFLATASETAALSMRKEAEALRRLASRTPPNSFVVRLVDVGTARFGTLHVPWVALEYVNGGSEGTTLRERVDRVVDATRMAFDPMRVARVVEQLRNALVDIHAVGVIHRDLKPENILCCGSGVDEILKIADFGIARSSGMEATFGIAIGTLGYAAPEQIAADPSRVGPWTDVYALAATVFFVLTGEDIVDASKPRRTLRTLSSAKHLHEDLRSRPSTIRALDELIQRSMSTRPEERPQSAALFAAAVVGSLAAESRPGSWQQRPRRLTFDTVHDSAWRWSVAHRGGQERVVRAVAWNSDGRCLVATGEGLSFWNGASWQDVEIRDAALADGLRFVRRLAPGEWLIGGDRATLALFSAAGIEEVLHGPDPSYSIAHASGDFRDLAVLVFVRPGDSPMLYCLCHGRWLKPLVLEDVAIVTSIARIGDAEWFVVGRTTSGEGWAARYTPLYWEIEVVESHATSLLSCASEREAGLLVAGSSDGFVLSWDGKSWSRQQLPGAPAIAAAALDPVQRAWVGTQGRIWLGWPERRMPWTPVWRGGSAPIVSIYADGGVVYAMTADATIIEGRPEISLATLPS